MKLFVDGDVFARQRYGGISRLYCKILPLLSKCDSRIDVSLVVSSNCGFNFAEDIGRMIVQMPQLSDRLRPWRFWSKIAPPINNAFADLFWRTKQADVFLSTYYTTPPIDAPSICVVYDMIYELFPECFDARECARVQSMKRKSVETARKIICISEQTRRDVVRFYGVPEDICDVIYLAGGINENTAVNGRSEIINRQRPYILYVGGCNASYKNFDSFVLSLVGDVQILKEYDILVATPCAVSDKIMKKYINEITSCRIQFIINPSDSELTGLYDNCSVFVYPSLYEGFGIPVLEALSRGAPVACSRSASMPEVGGNVVKYFNPESREEMISAIYLALSEGRSLAKEELRKQHARKFNWDNTAKGFVESLRRGMKIEG